MSEQQNIIYKVKEHIGVISRHNGWTTELNIISWNNGTPKFDVRDWNSDHSRMSRGITLTDYEMRSLIGLYMGIHNNMVWNAAKEKEAERKRQAEEYFKNRGREFDPELERVEKENIEGTVPPEERDEEAVYPEDLSDMLYHGASDDAFAGADSAGEAEPFSTGEGTEENAEGFDRENDGEEEPATF